MGYVYTGETGTPLKNIIKKLGGKNYDCIEFRIKWTDCQGKENDDLFGYCSYAEGELTPLDYDLYSLNDLYAEWEETIVDGRQILTMWSIGYEEAWNI